MLLSEAIVQKTRRWVAPSYRNSIYIMRHGRTALDDQHRSDGWMDFPLSDLGRVRLIPAQQYLKSIPLTHIYAPDFKRTTETAEIIQSGVLSSPDIIVSNDAKTWHMGVMTGTLKKPNKPVVQYLMAHPDEAPNGGESYAEFCGRFIPWLMTIKEVVMNGGGPVLIVTSGSNLREIGNYLMKDPLVFDLDEGGLMVIRVEDGKLSGEMVFGHKDENNDWVS